MNGGLIGEESRDLTRTSLDLRKTQRVAERITKLNRLRALCADVFFVNITNRPRSFKNRGLLAKILIKDHDFGSFG